MSESAVKNTILVSSSQANVCRVCEQVLSEIKMRGFGPDDLFGIHLAMEEALINAVRHGNGLDESKKVKVDYSVNCEKFDVTIEDEGSGFNPGQVPDPRDDENLYKASGRGLLLMRAYMDKVEYLGRGNQVHMYKVKSKGCGCGQGNA